MAHLFINHHFFYGNSGLGKALKGPSPDLVRRQVQALKNYMRPAENIWNDLGSSEPVFSITVDDGSRSVLEVLPIFLEEGVHVSLCICGLPTLHQEVLQIHKINLLRQEMGDAKIWQRLCDFFPIDFSSFPLPKGIDAATLYRYDQPLTRRLKTALNYQLNYHQTQEFVNPLFETVFGSEQDMCQRLYLGVQDLQALPAQVDVMFHGVAHRLWAELNKKAHQAELTPPPAVEKMLAQRYILSIPYGMDGVYEPHDVRQDAGAAVGAFTMKRTMDHNQDACGFWWLHRYDQADIYDAEGNVRDTILRPFLEQS